MRYKVIPLLASLLLFFSCEKDQKDELEGKWQLKEVTDASQVTHRVDTVWYNVQNGLFMYQLYSQGKYEFRYGYKERPDSRTVVFELTDMPKPLSEFLPLTDWSGPVRSFTIEMATGSQLILSSEGKQYKFHKF